MHQGVPLLEAVLAAGRPNERAHALEALGEKYFVPHGDVVAADGPTRNASTGHRNSRWRAVRLSAERGHPTLVAMTMLDTFLSEIDAILERAVPRSIELLRVPAARPPRLGEIFACFELYHFEDYGMNCTSFSIEDGELVTDCAAFPDDNFGSFLPELNSYIQGLYSDRFREAFEEAKGLGLYKGLWDQGTSEDFTARHERQLTIWFARLWDAAGGREAKVPAFFCFGKEYQLRDIFTFELFDEDEGARRLGYPIGT